MYGVGVAGLYIIHPGPLSLRIRRAHFAQPSNQEAHAVSLNQSGCHNHAGLRMFGELMQQKERLEIWVRLKRCETDACIIMTFFI